MIRTIIEIIEWVNPMSAPLGQKNADGNTQDIKKAVANMQVPKYNTAKATAALVGKSIDFTLYHPNGGELDTDYLVLSGLRGRGPLLHL